MHYTGSKARYAAAILAVTLAARSDGQAYVEPFVGGGNVINKVPRAGGRRIGNDMNWRMVALLDAVGNKGWLPPEDMTEADWNQVKSNPGQYDAPLVAFCATGCTFGSKWFDVWARGKDAHGVEVNRWRQARDNLLKDVDGLRGVEFFDGPYDAFPIPPESIIYCDPPYAGTLGYTGSRTTIEVGEDLSKNEWSRTAFWRWANRMSRDGHSVFVSEYRGPPAIIYDGLTPSLSRELGEALATYKAFTDNTPSSEFIRMQGVVAEIERRISVERERMATREWQSTWSKEVVSDFSSQRGGKSKTKKNTEHLFHRVPGP